MAKKKGNVFDYVNSILYTKEDLSDYEIEYVPFIINRALAAHPDCVLYANDINRYHELSKDLQYKYLILSIRKASRKFQPWTKKGEDREIEIIQQFYGYNHNKAVEAKSILKKSEIYELERKLIEGKGGVDEK